MPDVVLSLQNVTICYGDLMAVDDLHLDVERGEVFGLLGPNGCGKSTTISAIAGAMRPASGTIRVNGLLEADDPLRYRRQIGLAPQELALFDTLTVEQNLLFFARLYGLTGRILHKRVGEVLAFVQLHSHARRRVAALSGGMQRRLNLACALLHEPSLLLLDEPTVGVDIQSREAIFDNLRALRDKGCAVLITTHHLEEAEQLCDRIGIMDRGGLIALGDVAELCAELPEDDPPVNQRRWRRDGSHAGKPNTGLERVYLDLTGRSLRAS